MKKSIVVLAVIGILLLFTTMIFAASESNPVNQERSVADPQPASPVADVNISEVEIKWTPHVENKGLVLTISGPDGLYFRQEFARGVELTLGLLDGVGAALPDGSYNYELYAIPVLSPEQKRAMSAARDGDDAGLVMGSGQFVAPETLTQSGYFMVNGGSFVLPLVSETDRSADEVTDGEVSAVQSGNIVNVPSDQVILDDLIVDGSACIGTDCVNGESFGFDTIRIKENNLRIKFQDTSSSGSFPTNDWQITANDSANGGANKFSIDDIDGGRTPFTLEAGAPSNSLYVDNGGRVGIGTSNPVVEMHVVNGDSPTMRLEQNGSSGFTPQTWDLAGNETNFFIRDVTNGSKLPFRIRPGAPSSSIDIATDGDVGIGTASPAAALEVERSNGTAQILVDENNGTTATRTLLTLENNGGSKIDLSDSNLDVTWSLINNFQSKFFISLVGSGGAEFIIMENGRVQMGPGADIVFDLDTNGDLSIDGTLTQSSPFCGSDCRRQGGLTVMNEIDLLRSVNQLKLWEWSTTNSDQVVAKHASPLAKDFYALFDLGTETEIAPMDVSSVALLAVKDLYQIVMGKDVELATLQAENESLQVQVTDLETRLETLEAQVNALLQAQEGR